MSEISLGEVINGLVEANTSRLNTSLPGVIVKVRTDDYSVFLDVQPTVNMLTGAGESVPRSVILNVPTIMPLSSTGGLQFELNIGDPVLLVFSQRGLEAWKGSDGKPSVPTSMRMFDPRDCVAIPCVFPKQITPANPSKHKNSHSASDVVLVHNIGKSNEVEIRLKKSGDVVINCPGTVTVNSPQTIVNSDEATVNAETTINGNTVINGTLTVSVSVASPILAAGTSLTVQGKQMHEHRHGGVDTGPNNTGVPI